MDATTVSELWDRVIGTQPDPPWWIVAVAAAAALVAVAYGPTWRVSRTVVTIAHEGGHAMIALVTGRQLDGIRLHSDTSGVTVSRGKPHGPGMIFTAMAGYITPPLLGLGCAWLLSDGRITLMLWTAIALLAAMLIMIRNLYGVVSVVATGAIIFAVSWLGDATLQAGFAYLAAFFLLLAGARPVIELQQKRARRQARDSDADQLARLTSVPGLAWVGVFAVVAILALFFGVQLLTPESTTLPDLSELPGF